MALVLGIDSTLGSVSVGVTDAGRLVAEVTQGAPTSALVTLVPLIDHVLQIVQRELSDLDLLAVTTGPGSWAGIRVGVETAKIIALAADLPVLEISSLRALAGSVSGLSELPVVAIVDAKRSRLYAGTYDCSGEIPLEVVPPRLIRSAEARAMLNVNCLLVGDTHLLPGQAIGKRVLAPVYIHGTMVARIAEHDLAFRPALRARDISPTYLQQPLGERP